MHPSRVRWISVLVAQLISIMACPVTHAFTMREPTRPPGNFQINGKTLFASRDQWPSTYIFDGGLGPCTSTAVGELVILTAAHCVTNEEKGTISVNNNDISVTCYHHPDYTAGNKHADFALCRAENSLGTGPFEKVNSALAFPRMGYTITLLGYGCTEIGGFDGRFGILNTGTAIISRDPTPPDIDFIADGEAAVCFGDSGGAAYVMTNASGSSRAIAGVNSRGDIISKSYISATSTDLFVTWALSWAQQQQVKMCGLIVGTRNCRP